MYLSPPFDLVITLVVQEKFIPGQGFDNAHFLIRPGCILSLDGRYYFVFLCDILRQGDEGVTCF